MHVLQKFQSFLGPGPLSTLEYTGVAHEYKNHTVLGGWLTPPL